MNWTLFQHYDTSVSWFGRIVLCALGFHLLIGDLAKHGGFQRHVQLCARVPDRYSKLLSVERVFFDTLDQTSGHKLSGLDVAWIFVTRHPDHVYRFGGFSFDILNWVTRVNGPTDSSWPPSNVPLIVDTTLQQHIQCRICPPDNINKDILRYLDRWYSEWPYNWHIQLNTWLKRDNDKLWFPERLQKSPRASPSSVCSSDGWDPSVPPRRMSLCSSSCTGWSQIKVDVRSTWSLPANLIRCAPHTTHTQQRCQVRTFLPTGGVLTGLSQESDDIQPSTPKKNDWTTERFSKLPFVRSFPVCQEVLDIAQIALAFHGIWPPLFIQSRLQ